MLVIRICVKLKKVVETYVKGCKSTSPTHLTKALRKLLNNQKDNPFQRDQCDQMLQFLTIESTFQVEVQLNYNG